MCVLTDKGPNKINTCPSFKDFSKNEIEGGACVHVCADHTSALDTVPQELSVHLVISLSLELIHLA